MGDDPIGDINKDNIQQNKDLAENKTQLDGLQAANKTQNEKITANEKAIGQNSQILDQFGSILQQPPTEGPDNPSVGPNEWFRIYVPTKNTKLTMGKQDLGSSAEDIANGARHHYSGFTVTTEGHIHVYAGKKMVVESKGPLIIQSTAASSYFGAPGDALFGAQKGVYCGGVGGIVIHGGGGIGADPPVPDSKNAGTPDEPDAAGGAAALYADLTSQWNGFDAIVASAIVAKGAYEGITGLINNKATGVLKAVVALAGAGRDFFWASGAFSSAFKPGAMGGAVINGTSGVICTTAPVVGFTSVFARNGFMIGSLVHIFQSAKIAELCGVVNAGIDSGKLTSLDAGKEVEILAKKAVQVSSRTGGTHIDGKDIGIGGGGEGKQRETLMAIAAGENVDFESDDMAHMAADLRLTVSGDKVVLKGKSQAILAAKDNVYAHAKQSHLLMDGSDCYIGFGKGIGNMEKLPEPNFGNTKKGKAAIGAELLRSPNYMGYANKLKDHIKKVDSFKAEWSQIHLKDGQVKFSVGKFAVGYKSGDMDIGKKVDAKG